MVASTVCSSKGLTGTKESAEVVSEDTAALDEVDVVMGRANEEEIDFCAIVRSVQWGDGRRNPRCSGQGAQSAVSTGGSIAV